MLEWWGGILGSCKLLLSHFVFSHITYAYDWLNSEIVFNRIWSKLFISFIISSLSWSSYADFCPFSSIGQNYFFRHLQWRSVFFSNSNSNPIPRESNGVPHYRCYMSFCSHRNFAPLVHSGKHDYITIISTTKTTAPIRTKVCTWMPHNY